MLPDRRGFSRELASDGQTAQPKPDFLSLYPTLCLEVHSVQGSSGCEE